MKHNPLATPSQMPFSETIDESERIDPSRKQETEKLQSMQATEYSKRRRAKKSEDGRWKWEPPAKMTERQELTNKCVSPRYSTLVVIF
ncbi:hypothetical protein KCU62_g65, partial [Aureobasidium sp. EXF-3399]